MTCNFRTSPRRLYGDISTVDGVHFCAVSNVLLFIFFFNSRPLISLSLSIVHVLGVALQVVFVAEMAVKVVSQYIQLTGQAPAHLFRLEHNDMLGNHRINRLYITINQYSPKFFI